MLSRVAENLYWLGRYVERAENVARLLDVAYHLELDAAELKEEEPSAAPIEDVLSVLACREDFQKAHPGNGFAHADVLAYLTIENEDGQSIRTMLGRARENARASREALSADAWHQLNGLYLDLQSRRTRARLIQSPLRFLERLKRGCILFSGLIESTLPRAEAYHFLQVGRHLERINQIGRVLQLGMPPMPALKQETSASLSSLHWANLLRSCSAYEAYLQDVRDQIEPAGVVGFLVLNNSFPRSIRFCVERCCESLQAIGGESESYASEAERLLGRLESELRYVDEEELLRQGLQSFLVGLLSSCNRIGDEIHRAYFFI